MSSHPTDFQGSVIDALREAIERQIPIARYRLLDPRKIVAAGWDFLVNPVMREGGYVRYDEKTARELLDNCAMLINEYRGSLRRVHE